MQDKHKQRILEILLEPVAPLVQAIKETIREEFNIQATEGLRSHETGNIAVCVYLGNTYESIQQSGGVWLELEYDTVDLSVVRLTIDDYRHDRILKIGLDAPGSLEKMIQILKLYDWNTGEHNSSSLF